MQRFANWTNLSETTFLLQPTRPDADYPVTGSFNAGAAQWLIRSGRTPSSYLAAQGTVLGRAGRVHIETSGEDIWVGGDSVSCIEGSVLL